MPRLQGRCVRVRSYAADRLRDIENEIREILRTYPDLSSAGSNVYSRSRQAENFPTRSPRIWRPGALGSVRRTY